MSVGTRDMPGAQFDIPSLPHNKAKTRLCLRPEKKNKGGQFSLAKPGHRIMSKQYF